MRRAALVLALSAAAACRVPDEGRPVKPVDLAPAAVAPRLEAAFITFPDGSRLQAEVADTPEARERGLMDRTSLKDGDAMLFVFDAPQTLNFWMKDTWVDLDMLWLDAAGRVTTLHENVPKSKPGMTDGEVATRAGWGLYVLELKAGQARKRGALRGTALRLELAPRAR